jgi:hypothetical protein
VFIDVRRAREVARREITGGPGVGDPAFAAWQDAEPGEPLLVSDLAGRPAYWLVPVLRDGGTVGTVRVLPDGRAAAVAAVREGAAVSALGAAEAARRAEREINREAGEAAGTPDLVHDGPPGREAWRVEVSQAGRPTRWLFVTPGGVYERPAGKARDENLE